MNVFVTGATGFLGRAVVAALVKRQCEVTLLSRSGNFPGQELACHPVDLASGDGLAQVPWERCDVLVHLAAAGVKAGKRSALDCIAVNVAGTVRLLNVLSQRAPRARLVAARTYYEDYVATVPGLRENPYVASKAVASHCIRDWAKANPGRAVVLAKIFQVYGPGDDPANVLPYAARQLMANAPVELSSGKSEKDWVFIDDAAEAVVAATLAESTGLVEADVGSATTLSVRQMVELTASLAGRSPDLLHFNPARDRPDTEFRATASQFPFGNFATTRPEAGLRSLLHSLPV